jgi:hypothetical protein
MPDKIANMVGRVVEELTLALPKPTVVAIPIP